MTESSKLYARRGGEELSTEDVLVHLANLLRLENVGVFLGAGASKGAGGKTMKDVWLAFLRSNEAKSKQLVDNKYVSEEQSDPTKFDGEGSVAVPNVEELLDKLEIARQHLKHQADKPNSLKDVEGIIKSLLQEVIRAALLDESGWLNPGDESVDLGDHRKLLQRLVGARQAAQPSPWVFTTNYDLAVEWAAESLPIHVHSGFSGIHNRIFSPQSFDLGLRNTTALGEARFGCNDCYLVKLHGSLTWRQTGEADYRELAATEAWNHLSQFLEDESELDDSVMVFPRAAKYTQTVGYLSGELFRRFSDFLAKPQAALLIMGYSFSDEHLNRLLKSALLNPTLQLVVFLPELIDGSKAEMEKLKPSLRRLIELESPRITFVGGGSAAWFDNAVRLLPDPMLYDLSEKNMRERLFPKAPAGEEGDDAE